MFYDRYYDGAFLLGRLVQATAERLISEEAALEVEVTRERRRIKKEEVLNAWTWVLLSRLFSRSILRRPLIVPSVSRSNAFVLRHNGCHVIVRVSTSGCAQVSGSCEKMKNFEFEFEL